MSETITVTVKLFAAYQEVCGQSDLRWQFEPGEAVAAVGDRLYAQYPNLARWREVTRYGVNLQFVPPETLLQDGDEVVLIPPVSGG
ncbi:MAG: MoaD/ThiS family protein [Aphanocapsa sp. GSE-SYN-MK-11-07L]|nr:MoaD/ThiS family protein [Aphanocapsa sp. GSE-SYN-MK-11-07L]